MQDRIMQLVKALYITKVNMQIISSGRRLWF